MVSADLLNAVADGAEDSSNTCSNADEVATCITDVAQLQGFLGDVNVPISVTIESNLDTIQVKFVPKLTSGYIIMSFTDTVNASVTNSPKS